MNVERALDPDLDEPPPEEPEYWEDDELSPTELTRWLDGVQAAEHASGGAGWPGAGPPGSGAGSAAGGSVPDLIASVLAAAGEPATLTDAGLVEALVEWHAIAARAQARELRATEELLRRRRPRVWDRRADRAQTRREDLDGAVAGGPERAMPAVLPSREAAEEIALALTSTCYAAQAQVELAADLSRRLPGAFGELDAGRADLARIKVLAEATQFLCDEDAGTVDALLAPRLGRLTTGELRASGRRAVIKIDPRAAERRRSQAERKARFTLYGNDDQTATLAVERLPAQLGAAAKARVNAIARAAKAAGMTDPMALLEAKVAAGLLLGTLPDIPPAADTGPSGGGPPDGGWPGGETRDGRPALPWPRIAPTAGAAAPGCAGLPPWLRPKDPGRIRLTVPWRTLTGMGPEPGELSWAGPVTPDQARDLATAAAADPAASWRLIVTDDEGRAIAVSTLRAGHPGTGPPGMVGEVTVTLQQSLAAAAIGGGGRARDPRGPALSGELADLLAEAVPAANLAAAEAAARAAADAASGGCAHAMEALGYRVPGRLRRWLNTRDRTCRNPVCRQPAQRCDQDHTVAYHRGGRTCDCNLGGLCRVHHVLKQLPGWQLTQDARGRFTWRTPAGLTYREEPHRYPV